MNKPMTKARFWKCALQVNPCSYEQYTGQSHGLTEEEYNQKLLEYCLQENIKVVAITDHGKVDEIDAIRNSLIPSGIVVFPGFEINAEGAHFVCIYPEKTSKDQLNRFLGELGLTDIDDGTRRSKLTGLSLIEMVEKQGGVTYAAHCTEDNGLLSTKNTYPIWKSPLLKAAQIPNTLEALGDKSNFEHFRILSNRNQYYHRETPIAIINAKDVKQPKDLTDPRTSCLIKMTTPSFASFKQAFLDPDSRIRLNSDVTEKYYSRIESIRFIGGYLDGVDIEFSEHLNTIIGGRGTGKSTLLECIRYCLGMKPLGSGSIRQHDEIIKENLGKERGRVEIVVRSFAMNGKQYTISRSYGETCTVKEASGAVSSLTPTDLLPSIEIFGQNEIYELAKSEQGQAQLLNRFLGLSDSEFDRKVSEIQSKLAKNRKDILEAIIAKADMEEEVGQIPKLQEQINQLKHLNLEEKMKLIPLLEKEIQLISRAENEIKLMEESNQQMFDSLTDTTFLSDKAINDLPHVDQLRSIRSLLDQLHGKVKDHLSHIKKLLLEGRQSFDQQQKNLKEAIQHSDESITKSFKDIPNYEGRSGKEIGAQFQTLLKRMEQILPKKEQLNLKEQHLQVLRNQRAQLLDEWSALKASNSAFKHQNLKSLNKRLKGKIKIEFLPEANRLPLSNFLLECKLEGVGQKRLAWLESAEDFSPLKLADLIEAGVDALKNEPWGVTPTVADAMVKMPVEQKLQLQEITFSDSISIQLNVSHTEGQEDYRPLEKLSTGQQCTAILHMLLLDNQDPLIMDQPEDNLDNAFIADRIVQELRSKKISRQFLFATHNANIPVFGDAEWIGVFEVKDNHASISDDAQGAIDIPEIQQKAADILEGGRVAFIQRKEKYGF